MQNPYWDFAKSGDTRNVYPVICRFSLLNLIIPGVKADSAFYEGYSANFN